MAYCFNPKVFGAVFSLPSSVVDSYIKLASASQLKVILFIFRNSADGIDENKISEKLGIPLSEVEDALLFWKEREVLIDDTAARIKEQPVNKAVERNEKPSRVDVAKRGLEDPNIALVLRDAQLKFGRNLKMNEASTFVYLYDDLGLDTPVILFLLQYALSVGKLNIRFIEKTAVKWVNFEVTTVSDAERIISDEIKADLSWKRVLKAFGLERRKPSEKELSCAKLWFDEWHLEDEVLSIAYNLCVDAKSKFIFSYCAKIIENWHKNNLIKPEDIKKHLSQESSDKPQKNSYATYDLDLYEKMINSKD